MSLDINDYNYPLPQNLIAHQPSKFRDHCHLLSLNKTTSQIKHHHFFDLPKLLNPNDVLVLNRSKVFPARLFGKKASGGNIEILLIRQINSYLWLAISKPRPAVGQQLIFDHNLIAKVADSDPQTGQIKIKFNQKNKNFFKILNQIGQTPLPSYINSPQSELKLRTQYQTVFATKIGSAAAPTAGLHFTKKLLIDLKKRGVQIEYITLHVGLGTFQNLRPENLVSKTLHSEFYEISSKTAKRLNQAKAKGRQIIAVGTTTVRALESASQKFQNKSNLFYITPGQRSTDIFIYPPYQFKFIDSLITNFHLPKSSLLMLVSAFAGKKNILTAYQTAIDQKYHFFSFGDAMFIY